MLRGAEEYLFKRFLCIICLFFVCFIILLNCRSNPGQSEEGPVALSPSPQVPTIGENQQLQALSAKVQALTEKVQALAENSQGRRLPATRQVKVLPTTSQVPVHTQTRPQTCHIPLKTETAPDRYIDALQRSESR